MADVVKVTLNGDTLIDISDSTVEADKVLSSYVGYEGDGDRFTGTYVAPSAITVSAFTTTSNGTFTAPSGYAYSPVTVDVPTSGSTCTATITGTGAYGMTYVCVNGVEYYTDGDTFTFSEGDNIYLYSSTTQDRTGSSIITVDGTIVSSVTGSPTNYTFEAPDGNISISLSHGSVSEVAVRTKRYVYVQNNRTVSLTASPTVITPDSSFDAMSQVTVTYVNKETDIIMRTISGSYVNPNVTTVGSYAFYSCRSLNMVSFPMCSSISPYAFASCSSLVSAYFPICERIGGYAFAYCSNLKTVSFPSCTSIENNAFQGCSRSLTNVNFPMVTNIGSSAFISCSSLSTALFPLCTSIGGGAVSNCSKLRTIDLSLCTVINAFTFYSCNTLSSVDFPIVSYIGNSAFRYCSLLTMISFPSCSYIGTYAFGNCVGLFSAYFLGSSVPNLVGATAFTATPISTAGTNDGYIYVRESLYESFITATNWSLYSSKIVSLTDTEIEALG